jgi:6-phosphogluconolactonase (cycloisomerase 2 family)
MSRTSKPSLSHSWLSLALALGFFVAVAFSLALALPFANAAAEDLLYFVTAVPGPYGVLTPSDMVLSPDGANLYVTDVDDDSVVVFKRDSTTGAVKLVQVQTKSDAGPLGDFSKPGAVAITPDGAFVYVFGTESNGGGVYVTFARSAQNGQLTPVQPSGATLRGIESAVVSADGNYLYTASTGDRAIVVYARNPTTGELSQIQQLRDGQDGVDGLDEVSHLAFSPDNQHLYAAGSFDRALAVFSRDPATGALSFVEALFNGDNGINGLDNVRAVVVSPDGKHVYASGYENAIVVFSRNETTGALSLVEILQQGVNGVSGLEGPRALAFSPDGATLYVSSSRPQFDAQFQPLGFTSALTLFQRNSATGSLTFLEAHTTTRTSWNQALNDTRPGVVVSPAGQHVYHTPPDSLVYATRSATTGLLAPVVEERITYHAPGPVFQLGHIAISPDGKHLFAPAQGNLIPNRGDSGFTVFNRSVTTGTLTALEVHRETQLYGPMQVTLSPGGEHVYVIGPESLLIYRRDTVDGWLQLVDEETYMPSHGSPLITLRAITLSPDGANAYISAGTMSGPAIAVFSRETPTGTLTFQTTTELSASSATALIVSPDNAHLYAAHRDGNVVTIFGRNQATGALTPLDSVGNLLGPQGLALSPDGKFLYVAETNGGAVSVFERNALTGAVVFVEREQQGVAGVDGLFAPERLQVSPNGQYLFVAGGGFIQAEDDFRHGVAAFERNDTTGALSFRQALKPGDDPAINLWNARDLVVSPDGTFLYVSNTTGQTIVVFRIGTTPIETPTLLPTSTSTATLIPTSTSEPISTPTATVTPPTPALRVLLPAIQN